MTFTFTMDAFPGYTIFDKTKKVLCVMQIINSDESTSSIGTTVMGHVDSEDFTDDDSSDDSGDVTP